MLTQEQQDKLLKEHTQEVNSQLKKIDDVLQTANLQNPETLDNLVQYTHYTLYKLSVLNAFYLLSDQLGEKVASSKIDELIGIFSEMVHQYKKRVTYKGVDISPKKIRENYRVFSSGTCETLHVFLVKMHYLISTIEDVLAVGRNWMKQVTQLRCDMVVMAQNLLNVDLLVKKDSSEEYQIFDKMAKIVIDLARETARSCVTLYGYTKKDPEWLVKALHILRATKRLGQIQKNQTLVLDIENRMKRVVKQFNHDIHLYEDKTTSIDDLLKIEEL